MLIPTVLGSLLLFFCLQADLRDCTANYSDPLFNDEIHYWNEIATYRRAGFAGGYFTVSERPAVARWCHFGPHGPGFAVVYGSLARLLGWEAASGPCFNLIVLAAGMTAWILLARPDAVRLALAIAMMVSFWPAFLFLPSTLQESLHCAIAFALAGLAHQGICAREGAARSFWPLLAGVVAAALVRVTWSLVLIPWAVVALPELNRRSRLIILATLAVSMPAMVLAWAYLASPYPNYLAQLLEIARQSPAEAVDLFLWRARQSVVEFLSRDGEPIDWLLRYQVLALIAVGVGALLPASGPSRGRRIAVSAALIGVLSLCCLEFIGGLVLVAIGIWSRRQHRPYAIAVASLAGLGCLYFVTLEPVFIDLLGNQRAAIARLVLLLALVALHHRAIGPVRVALAQWLRGEKRRAYVFAGLNLVPVALLVVLFYDVGDWRAYRVLAPHLLLSMLVIVSSAAWLPVLSLAATNLLFTSAFLSAFVAIHKPRVDPADVRTVDLGNYIAFDPAASPWDNTLLVWEMHLWPRVRVPAGIGVTFQYGYDLRMPPRSRYVLIAETHADLPQWRICGLELIAKTPFGNLYCNPGPGNDDQMTR